MAKLKVKVTVTPGPSVNLVSITIDGNTVPLVNNEGIVSLESPDRYILIWHFTGNSGETLGIKVETDAKAVLEIKKSRIPADESAGAGIDRFDI
jgi:hypothetical protein